MTTEINDSPVSDGGDTHQALSLVKIKGVVTDVAGIPMSGFSGTVFTSVFDKRVSYTTLANQDKSYAQLFQVQNMKLFEGKASVNNGAFEFSFTMPRDVNSLYGPGRISFYASSGSQDAHGYYASVVIGGEDQSVDPVNPGPEISLYMDHRGFVSGGRTGTEPTLIADLSDDQGINAIDLGIGHEIIAVLDEDWAHPVVLNTYYQPETDDYQIRNGFLSAGTYGAGDAHAHSESMGPV